MDPLAHTLFGAALAESGLKRRSRYATATLLIGANLPDIDVVAGQDQTVTLNRAAPIENANVMQPGRVQTFTGQLRRGDTVRPTNQYADSHYFDWVAGQTVRVELDSDDVDTYLIVTAPSGIAQHNDDRPDGTLNSALTIQVNETGRWHVQASTYGPYSTGDYTLRVHGP